MDTHVEVVGAVIVRSGQVLCAQRGPAGSQAALWEFPGGKVEPGESPAAALVREIREELGCDIEVGAPLTTTTHAYPSITISLTTFWCALGSGEPVPREHARISWEPPETLDRLEWAPADIPAVDLIRRSDAAG